LQGLLFHPARNRWTKCRRTSSALQTHLPAKAQFESALSNIYLRVRTDMYAASDAKENYDLMGIDADFADVGWWRYCHPYV
jgi:hypothetical protein